MSHFAQVVNGIVTYVIVAEQDVIDRLTAENAVTSSTHAIHSGTWIQTSINTRGNVHYTPYHPHIPDGGTALRGNYAAVGYIYDSENDVFYPPQPYAGWMISSATNWLWEPPVPHPDDGFVYKWDNSTTNWVTPETGPVAYVARPLFIGTYSEVYTATASPLGRVSLTPVVVGGGAAT